MSKIANAEPTLYSPTDAKDNESIDLFRHLLEKNRARHDGVVARDTSPNIDGRIIITTSQGKSIGELKIQVKTLEEKNISNPKYQCKIGFLNYCYHHKQVPVLLIVVDNKNSCAYWIHINKSLLKELDEKITGDSININFPKENIISKADLTYLDKWQSIIEEQDKFLTEAAEFSDKYISLQKHVENLNRITGEHEINENVFVEIHKFLDYLNQTWDREFLTIKEQLYPQVWKFGIGYSDFSKNKTTLSLYPVMYNNNILPIKKFGSLNSLTPDFFSLYSFGNENPILNKPWEFAYEIIQKDVISFLTERRIGLYSNSVLAKEYIFGFINIYGYLMGLQQKDKYELKEVSESIITTLYQNSHKIASQHPELLDGPFFNIDKISMHLNKSEIDRCLALPFVKQERVMLKTGNFHATFIIKLLSFLNDIDEKVVSNIYPLRKYLNTNDIHHMADLSNEDKVARVKGIYSNLAKAYDDFVYSNFEHLEEQLALFKETDLIIVIVDVNDTSFIQKYAFKTIDAQPENQIRVLERTTNMIYDYATHRDELHSGVMIDGKTRKLVWHANEALRINTKMTPLLDLVHEIVIENLKKYFAFHIRKENY